MLNRSMFQKEFIMDIFITCTGLVSSVEVFVYVFAIVSWVAVPALFALCVSLGLTSRYGVAFVLLVLS